MSWGSKSNPWNQHIKGCWHPNRCGWVIWGNFWEDPIDQKHFLYCQHLWIRKTFIWKWDFVCHTFWSTYHQSRLSFYNFCRYFSCNRSLKDQRGFEWFDGEHWTHPLALAMWNQVAGFYQRSCYYVYFQIFFLFFNIPWKHNNAYFDGLLSPNSDELYVGSKLYVALTAIAPGSATLNHDPATAIRFLRIFPHTAIQLWVKQICTQMLTLL